MAVQGKIVARKQPNGSQLKYYVSPKIVKMASERDVAKLISHGMTITEEEALLAVRQTVYAVLTLLQQSHSVKIAKLGTFSLSFSSDGSETAEEVTVSNVKRINCNLRIDNEFREELQKTEIVIMKDKKN